ncbi:uncharacterized protein LOC133778085 [Humulus lupulus]|uniref:uncharacterized protein LOC133778085 n=1 Tax=Humulus lupulus TaxID=3486 RepID=UPI002B40C3DD|nr:uncharacterized protein LOC133778085 [Humulus lupulus]
MYSQAQNMDTRAGDRVILRSEIEAVQTVPPSKITAPRKVRQVSWSPAAAMGSDNVWGYWGGCFHMVLYYKKHHLGVSGEDSGSIHAGWIKESLATALSHQPLLSGRLQKSERSILENGDGDEEGEVVHEIVANDAGARLIEARLPVTISEFLLDLDSSSKSYSSKKEAELVFWKDVDETDPRFCPLFYVQVTKFVCGGYSFGISCSLLLVDLLFKENFLKKWADIHKNLVSKERPLFYLPNIKYTPASDITDVISSRASQDSGQTIIFNVTYSNEDNPSITTTLALLCVEEAGNKLGTKMDLEFSLSYHSYVKEPSKNNMVMKLEKCSKYDQLASKKNLSLKNRINNASWDDFGTKELEFRNGNEPLSVSNWIGSVTKRFVVTIPYYYDNHGNISGVKVIVKMDSK